MRQTELITSFLDSLHRVGTDVVVDIADDPPCVVARTRSGRVFAAAWPTDGSLSVRLRLDAIVPEVPTLEHIGSGSLAYEIVVTDQSQLAEVEALFERAHELANRGHV
jgi:hypothetical protein